MTDKKADLAGPGIGSYEDLEKILPQDYKPLLTPKETQIAITAAKNYIEEGLCGRRPSGRGSHWSSSVRGWGKAFRLIC